MNRYALLICSLCCLLLAGCSREAKDTIAPGWGIVGREVNLTADGGVVTVTLSGDAVGAKSNQGWCTAEVSGTTVTVTVEANPDLDGRTAQITVTKGVESLAFPVTQIGNRAPLPEVNAVRFDAGGGVRKIHVDHAASFTAVSEKDWVAAEVSGDTLVLTARQNCTSDTNAATVKLVSGRLESEMTVTQSGIVLVPETRAVWLHNSGDTLRIGVNSTLPFTAESSEPAWLTVTAGTDFIVLAAANNSGHPERKAAVTLTSQTVSVTIAVTQRDPGYADYLGNWVLAGEDNGKELIYFLSVTEGDAAPFTYKVSGWGRSVVAISSQYALTAYFDPLEGSIVIPSQENIAVYTDDAGEQYDVAYYGQAEMDGETYLISGNYICYKGMLQHDGKVQWKNGTVRLPDGNEYGLAGALYFIVSKTGGNNVFSFSVDHPSMKDPVMGKAGFPAFRGSGSAARSAVMTQYRRLMAVP